MYKNADHSTMRNSQEQGTTQMSTNSRMDKVWHIHTMEMSQQCKRTNSAICINVDDSHRHNVDQKKADAKEYNVEDFYKFQKQA